MDSDTFFTKDRINLLKSLKVDVFLTLFNVCVYICTVSGNQLVEDKICLNQLQLNESICLNIENVDETQETAKNYILSTAAQFKNHQMIVLTLPGIFLSLFTGYWVDTYPNHIRWILAFPALGGTIAGLISIYVCLDFETDYRLLLLGEAFRGFSGGFASVYTGVYTYITRKTPKKSRSLRFAILEVFQSIASPISTYLGGQILTAEPWFAYQRRNYAGVFILSSACSAFGFIWILILLDDADCKKSNEFEIVVKVEPGNWVIPPNHSVSSSSESKSKPKGWFRSFAVTFKDIFNFTNVSNMFHTCTKKRPNGLRSRVWHSLVMICLVLLCQMGEITIGFPFAQKVYHWDAKYYSNVTSIFMIMVTASSLFTVPVLVRKFKVTDTRLGLLGCISLVSSMTIRGFWLTPTGFYVSNVCNVVSGLMPIAIRSFLARMISVNEFGQIYALLSAIESWTPAIASLLYSSIFDATISFYPGLVYLVVAVIMIYPMVTITWLDLTKSTWYDTGTSNNESLDKTNGANAS